MFLLQKQSKKALQEYLCHIFSLYLQSTMKTTIKILKYISIVFAVLVALFLTGTALLRLDSVKYRLASFVTGEISSLLNTPVTIRSIEIKNFNEVTLEEVLLLDRESDTLIYARKAMASLEPSSLLNGAVSINTLAFEAPLIRLSRPTPDEPANIQFILDNISKDSTEKDTDLRINQLLVYDGKFSYDVKSEEHIADRLDPYHIAIKDFSCNISLKNFNKENLNLYIRSIKGREASGLELKRVKARIFTQDNGLRFTDFLVELPDSDIESDSVQISNIGAGIEHMCIGGELHSSNFSFKDIQPIFPQIQQTIPDITFDIDATIGNSAAQGTASLAAKDRSFIFDGKAMVDNPYSKERTINAVVDKLYINELRLEELTSQFPDIPGGIAAKLGNTNLTGEFTLSKDSIECSFAAQCKNGTLNAEILMDTLGCYRLIAQGGDINIGNISGYKDAEKCDITVKSNGHINARNYLAHFEAEIDSLGFKGYTYSPFAIKGKAGNTGINADISTTDPNIKGHAAFLYSKDSKGEKYALTLDIDTFIPHRLNLVKEYKDNSLTFSMEGEHLSLDGERSMTNVKVRDLVYFDGIEKNFIKNIYIYDDNTDKERATTINSDIISADIIGNFDISSIHEGILDIVRTHLPSLKVAKGKENRNNFLYRIEMKDSKLLTKVLDLPFTINGRSIISGSCLDSRNTFDLDAQINDIDLGSTHLQVISLKGTSDKEKLDLDANILKPSATKDKESAGNDMIINLHSSASRDSINSFIDWSSLSDKTGKGDIDFGLSLLRDEKDKLNFDARIAPSSFILDGEEWHIEPGSITGNSERFIVDNLKMYSNGQSLEIDGTAGKFIDDSLEITLKDLEVSTLLGFTNFHALEFGGKATGKAHLTSILHSLDVDGRFDVDSLLINNAHMGDGDIGIGWMNYNKTLSLDCDIIGKTATSKVAGFLSQPRDTMILKIDANDLNVGFLEDMIDSFISEIDGTANGTAYVLGSWNKLDLTGAAALNSSLKVNANNTTYYVDGDTIYMSHGKLLFDNIGISDRNRNKGTLSGLLTHKHFSQWTCDLNIEARNMLVYETHSFDNLPFYGTVYASGTANINSPGSGLILKANLRSEPNSYFIYNSTTASGARDNSFVTFIDSRKNNRNTKETPEITQGNTYDFVTSKLNLDFMLDITESFHVKVYTNLKTDDYIDFYGKGTINALYDEKDGFSMKGGLELDRGTYKFTIQDIFPKEFKIEKGSTLTFDGDPFHAGLDLKTKYLVASASLGDLTTEVSRDKTVKVNCVMDIGGTLESPDLNFDLELPEGSEEEKEILASIANTKEQKNMQFIYLLGVGKFYTFDYNDTDEESQSSTAVESLISNTLSGQLNNMLGQIIDNDNWDISGNFSTSERGWNRMEVEGMLRGRLLNNRLLINGNLGYRENPIANSNFIGDFEIQYLLNKKGTVNLKAYSKTNDRYFSKTNLTTQGAGLLFKFDFNKWRWWKKDDENE